MLRRFGSHVFIRKFWFCAILILLAGGFAWIGLHQGVRQGQAIMMGLLAGLCAVLAVVLAVGVREREIRLPIWTASTSRNVLMTTLVLLIVVVIPLCWWVLWPEVE